MMGHPSISGNDAPFDEFIEVINDYEHESLTGSAVFQVKGSLRRNISFWHDIGAPEFILSIIQDGYRLPFETIPSGNVLNNNVFFALSKICRGNNFRTLAFVSDGRSPSSPLCG